MLYYQVYLIELPENGQQKTCASGKVPLSAQILTSLYYTNPN